MNLAELRKKAKQGRERDCLPEECPVPVQLIASVEPLPVADLPLVVIPEPQAETQPQPGEPAPAPVPFDPLAVLLSGREAALADDAGFAEAAANEAGDVQEFLCFKVSTEVYAINIMAIKEIIKPREVTEVPRAPEFVAGVLSLRGIIIPVFHMGLRLGLPIEAKSAKERIIVVKKGEEFFGIIVDEVIQVVKIATATMEKPPAVLEGIDRDFVSGIGRFEGQMLIVLNQEKILDLTLI